MFSKILIANRGEIACRVLRAAHAMGYATVAVHSDADADALHVREADEAVRIGAAPAAQSYLQIEAILAAARRTGADAIHPGYGFLSENAAFAQACIDAGLVFIGPPPAAIREMADKAQAKQRMLAAGVPCAPGYLGADQDDARLAHEAAALGFPLLVKAVAGGGGRGMRLVARAADLAEAIRGARSEAQGAFGDARLMLERLIEDGRHIEVQVFADAHGNAIHLGERDCTAQRRRQKLIEEAPSPIVEAALREAMGRDAVAAARAVGYVGAGTVEFIVDGRRRHHFLEMNTRLQVEHPVTECITGIDLVEWQLRIAAGEALPLAQHELRFQGHAIEARLYAEDPYAKPAPFAPQSGRLRWWRPEAAAALPGVRIDHGIAERGEVTPFYDPLVAKIIAHGRDRDEAIRRLRRALRSAPLLGLRHNGGFLCALLDDPAFRTAAMTTTLVDAWFAGDDAIARRPAASDEAWCVAGALFAQGEAAGGRAGWRSPGVAGFDLVLACDDQTRRLRLEPQRDGSVQVGQGGQGGARHTVQLDGTAAGELSCSIDGIRCRAIALRDGDDLHLAFGGAQFIFSEPSALARAASSAGAGRIRASVAGVVCQLAVRIGDAVEAGQPLVCVEAMKMQMWLVAPAAATVLALHAPIGAQVAAGTLLVELQAP
jgi:geranyl-CoA carboxylase alpha subunit